MNIIYSKHAQQKLDERQIRHEKVEEVLRKPEFLFYDIMNKTIIGISRVNLEDLETNLVVVFTKESDYIKVVTVYPCRDIKREISKKEGSRWVRI